MIRKILFPFSLLILHISSFLFSCNKFKNTDYLREGFIHPPDSASPGVCWNFMDGNLNSQSITTELETIKSSGFRFVMLSADKAAADGSSAGFMSSEWIELFAHVVKECERLGVQLILEAGIGGPWITPDKSMMHLVAYDTTLTGPQIFSGKLPVPESLSLNTGENNLPEELRITSDKWYKDVRVLAFPAPERKVKINNLDEKALYRRPSFKSQTGVDPFLPGLPDKETALSSVRKEKIQDVTINLKPDGNFQWSVPPGKWSVIRFGIRNSGSAIYPSSLAGPGFAVDIFDTSAVRQHFDAFIGRLISRVKPVKTETGGGWTMINIGTQITGSQNWSHLFIEEFIKRRSYDPMLYLPVFAGFIVNSEDESERFLWDVRQTANDLVIDNLADYLRKLGRLNRLRLSVQTSGIGQANGLDLGKIADIPVGEFILNGSGINSVISCIGAVSTGHVTGKQLIGAEVSSPDGQETRKIYPALIKNQTDQAFGMGVNRILFDIFQNIPPGKSAGTNGPGMIPSDTWQLMVTEYNKYLSRCQFMLSQGRPVVDMLYLVSEGSPRVFIPPSSALYRADSMPDKRGYSFDACSPEYLINNAVAGKDGIHFPGGAVYRILVLPDLLTMTPELAGKIDRLLREGAVITGFAPQKSPSLTNYPLCDTTVKKISGMVWKKNLPDTGVIMVPYGPGIMYRIGRHSGKTGFSGQELYPSYEVTAKNILKHIGTKEDFLSSGNIRYIHRSAGNREIYFVSNTTGQAIADSCFFRDGTTKAELWDPVSGEMMTLNNLAVSNKGIGARIRLESRQSFFIIFYQRAAEQLMKKVVHRPVNERYPILDISGLLSEKTDTATAINDYDGIITYSCYFSIPDSSAIRKWENLYIDIGSVSTFARIRLNGKEMGILWAAPNYLKVNGILKQINNHLEIEVGNLPVLPSGITGPVRIVASN